MSLKTKDTKPKARDTLFYTKLRKDAHAPVRGSVGAAGLDLASVENIQIPPGENALVPTGLSIEIPNDCYGRIAPRSGLALRYSVSVHAGVIDPDYRGHLQVLLFNHGKKTMEILKGDRIAQLVCEKIRFPEAVEKPKLSETDRAEGGFGSTGIASQQQEEISSEEECDCP
nr:unknown [Agrotis segetum granulovirus]